MHWIGWLIEQRTYCMHVWEEFHPSWCRHLLVHKMLRRSNRQQCSPGSEHISILAVRCFFLTCLVGRSKKSTCVSNTSPRFYCAFVVLKSQWMPVRCFCVWGVEKPMTGFLQNQNQICFITHFNARQVLVLSLSSSRARDKSVEPDNVLLADLVDPPRVSWWLLLA